MTIRVFERRKKSNSSSSIRLLANCTIILLGVLAPPTFGHAPSWSVDTDASPLTLHLTYTDGNPMAFAKVRVLSPDGQVYQVGNADRNGFFSFVPIKNSNTSPSAESENWTVKASGDEGHEIVAQVSPTASSDIQSRQFIMSSSLAWLLVVSVILNFAFLGTKLENFVRRRSRSTDN